MQSFQRDKEGWFETSSKGIVRRCTAEQTLSHLLPPLAGVSRAIVRWKGYRLKNHVDINLNYNFVAAGLNFNAQNGGLRRVLFCFRLF